jgi:hypothetical protein
MAAGASTAASNAHEGAESMRRCFWFRWSGLTNGASYWLFVYAAVAGGVFVGATSLAGRTAGVIPWWLAYVAYAALPSASRAFR